MSARPEQHVLDAIDQLVDESLAHGPTDDYNKDWAETCDACCHEWHGQQCVMCGCPGVYATAEQRAAWQAPEPYVRIWSADYALLWSGYISVRCEQCQRDLGSRHVSVRYTGAGRTHVTNERGRYCDECRGMRERAAARAVAAEVRRLRAQRQPIDWTQSPPIPQPQQIPREFSGRYTIEMLAGLRDAAWDNRPWRYTITIGDNETR